METMRECNKFRLEPFSPSNKFHPIHFQRADHLRMDFYSNLCFIYVCSLFGLYTSWLIFSTSHEFRLRCCIFLINFFPLQSKVIHGTLVVRIMHKGNLAGLRIIELAFQGLQIKFLCVPYSVNFIYSSYLHPHFLRFPAPMKMVSIDVIPDEEFPARILTATRQWESCYPGRYDIDSHSKAVAMCSELAYEIPTSFGWISCDVSHNKSKHHLHCTNHRGVTASNKEELNGLLLS